MDTLNPKKMLWEKVDEQKDELIKLCSDLISINSENPPGHMDEITDFICNYLKQCGIGSKVLRPIPDKPNIIARVGTGGRTLVLNGHSDVVPAGDREKWDFDPFSGEVRDGKILGRGTSDMKAGIAGLLFALGLIVKNKVNLKGQALLTVVPDEEVSGQWGTKWLVDNGYATGDACIVAEPTSFNNIEIGQKGSVWTKIKAVGKTAHGSLAPYVGDNAIEKVIKILEELKTLRDIPAQYPQEIAKVVKDSKDIASQVLKAPGVENIIDHVTVNIGKISGGIKTNMVPDYAEAEVDVRIPVGVKNTVVKDKIDETIKKYNLTGITYDYNWKSEANYTDVKSEIVELLAKNAKDVLGIDVSRTYQWASSDARYFRQKGIPTLQYGPANTEGIHSYNETVDVKDVISATKIYIGTILDFLGWC